MLVVLSIIGFFLYIHYTNHPRNLSLNNPFALAMGEYVHHRSPPPVPGARNGSSGGNGARRSPPSDGSQKAPPRPALPPPLYEEVAGSKGREYPREKALASASLPQRRGPPPPRTRERRSLALSAEGRRRDRERRRKKRSPKKPEPVKSKNLDTIDKLDVTGFFGGGFHHDGPFDACAPHRNKDRAGTKKKFAPVEAFPIDGPNNSLTNFPKTAGQHQQMDLAFGNYADENMIVGRKASMKKPMRTRLDETVPTVAPSVDTDLPSLNPLVVPFNANGKTSEVHGLTTAGLGLLTFIDGAPAPRLALNGLDIGITRKKLIVQRLRKNSSTEDTLRRNSQDDVDENVTLLLIRRVKSLKVRR